MTKWWKNTHLATFLGRPKARYLENTAGVSEKVFFLFSYLIYDIDSFYMYMVKILHKMYIYLAFFHWLFNSNIIILANKWGYRYQSRLRKWYIIYGTDGIKINRWIGEINLAVHRIFIYIPFINLYVYIWIKTLGEYLTPCI